VLVWVAWALLAAAAAVVLRWALRRVDALGRARPFPVFSVAVLLVLAGAAWVTVYRHDALQRRLSDVASELVGHRVRVDCQTAGQSFVDATGDLGHVPFQNGRPSGPALVKLEQCTAIRHYLDDHGRAPTPEQVVAVHVLTHEAMHLAGTLDEARAECQAMQRDAWTARLLGASPGDAHALAADYWRTVYPRMPDGYRSGSCAAGTEWDEGGSDAPWR
jgi:hypothetical protein